MAGRFRPTAEQAAELTAHVQEWEQHIARGTMTFQDWHAKAIYELFVTQDDEKALVACERALRDRPDVAQLWDLKGSAFAELERHAEALAAFERALELDPMLPTARYHRELALRQLGREGHSAEDPQ
jgi:tetratricopeptide (TPR) repeat protein